MACLGSYRKGELVLHNGVTILGYTDYVSRLSGQSRCANSSSSLCVLLSFLCSR